MASDSEIFWYAVLRPDKRKAPAPQGRRIERRKCVVCDEQVDLDDPAAVRTRVFPIGHRPDCRALAIENIIRNCGSVMTPCTWDSTVLNFSTTATTWDCI